ncbi:ATPase [Flavobacterium sp. Leaf359]|nr:ATPase [Flavobacterium sp. Leaf359]
MKIKNYGKKELTIKVAIQILKPVSEVFEAIVDPEKMANYFIGKGSGRMEKGKEIEWKFPEFDMQFPITVGKIEKDKYVSYYWDVNEKKNLVEITLAPFGKDTVVTVTEKGMENNEEGISWLMGNTEGWANFLACLKAYLEYGINLRKGAFEFRREE